ncbi:MAG: glutathione S-transferase N-terminal domain-containing protein [Caulobacter sp.]|nr:glutathione S-transferase N-terminal domain-containing protein [Caulobacter sp.]
MDLYFSPLACSMATRIAAYEAGAAINFLKVDTKASPKRVVDDGAVFTHINPMGQVPVLRTDDGELLFENPVILRYVADRFPHAHLIPADGPGRRRVESWLAFIASELHAGAFIALLRPTAPEGAKAFARESLNERFAFLDAHLTGREFLHDGFGVADAYLFVILNWSRALRLDLSAWPALSAYRERLQSRPSVARALSEEFALYKAAA